MRPQAWAKGTQQFTSSTKAAATPPREAAGMPSHRLMLRFRARALARSTVPSSSGGVSLSWATRAQYSSFRFMNGPPPLRR